MNYETADFKQFVILIIFLNYFYKCFDNIPQEERYFKTIILSVFAMEMVPKLKTIIKPF
jgi:hypothetical protein